VDLERLDALISPCRLCPRECGAERLLGETGFCKCTADALVGSVGPHHGEEPVLVGRGGSGTVFFAGCNLMCRFCQNWGLSHLLEGQAADAEEVARAMAGLAARGCENFNFVTPTHFAPTVGRAIEIARSWGLELPVVYNCGGYESLEALECLDGLVEIYMPDFKTLDADFAERALLARDYPERAGAALREMQRQVGDLRVDARGVATGGLLVRHLVMPGQVEDSLKCLDFLAGEISPRAFVNVMGQYSPRGEADRVEGLDRRPTGDEVFDARGHARKLGLRLARD
jgi:putative pyruvate formate lyase activating enzyme